MNLRLQFAILFVFALCFAGCGGSDSPTETTAQKVGLQDRQQIKNPAELPTSQNHAVRSINLADQSSANFPTGNGIDTSYITDDFVSAAVAHPAQLMSLPFLSEESFQSLKDRKIHLGGLWEMVFSDDKLLPLRQMKQVVFLVPEAPNKKGVGIILRFQNPKIVTELKAKLFRATHLEEKAEYQGKEYFRSIFKAPVDQAAAACPDEKTMIFAPESILKKMLTSNGAQTPLIDSLKDADSQQDISFYGDAASLKMLAQNSLKILAQQYSPARDLRMFSDSIISDEMKSLSVAFKLTPTPTLFIASEPKNPKLLAEVEKKLKKFIELGKQWTASSKGQTIGFFNHAFEKTELRLLDNIKDRLAKVFAVAKPAKSSTSVAVKLEMNEELDQLVKQLGPILTTARDLPPTAKQSPVVGIDIPYIPAGRDFALVIHPKRILSRCKNPTVVAEHLRANTELLRGLSVFEKFIPLTSIDQIVFLFSSQGGLHNVLTIVKVEPNQIAKLETWLEDRKSHQDIQVRKEEFNSRMYYTVDERINKYGLMIKDPTTLILGASFEYVIIGMEDRETTSKQLVNELSAVDSNQDLIMIGNLEVMREAPKKILEAQQYMLDSYNSDPDFFELDSPAPLTIEDVESGKPSNQKASKTNSPEKAEPGSLSILSQVINLFKLQDGSMKVFQMKLENNRVTLSALSKYPSNERKFQFKVEEVFQQFKSNTNSIPTSIRAKATPIIQSLKLEKGSAPGTVTLNDTGSLETLLQLLQYQPVLDTP